MEKIIQEVANGIRAELRDTAQVIKKDINQIIAGLRHHASVQERSIRTDIENDLTNLRQGIVDELTTVYARLGKLEEQANAYAEKYAALVDSKIKDAVEKLQAEVDAKITAAFANFNKSV
jgi:hypothetical protein